MSAKRSKRVFVYGASGHASFVLNILGLNKGIEVVGVLDDMSPQRTGEEFQGLKVLGGRDALAGLKRRGIVGCVLGFGNCSARLNLAKCLREEGFELVSAIHPMAAIAATAKIGPGTVIGPGVTVDAGCTIEENCILNNNCCISHGTYVGAGTHICPGVTIGGDVRVGAGSWIGIGSVLIQRVSVGSGCYIGAGALVTKDMPCNVLAYGIPAKVIRSIHHNF